MFCNRVTSRVISAVAASCADGCGQSRLWSLFACLFLCAPAAVLAEALAEAEGVPMPELTPGKEMRINDPQTGGLGYWMLYLPADYDDQQRWPILFNFHGLNQQPGLWPFAELTERRGFIIVGMEYLQRGLEGIDRAAEARNLQRILSLLSQWLSVDEQRRFIGGFSKGGWHTSRMAERTAQLWAGAVILGAGRSASPDASGLKDKAIFIGIGEQDGENASAAAAADFYRQIGAEVTFTRFSGIGHSVDVNDPVLKQWLAEQGAVSGSSPANADR